MADIALNMQTDSSKPARACNWCGTDISHRRSNARWCDNGNRCASNSYRNDHLEDRRAASRDYHARVFGKDYDAKDCSWCGIEFKPRTYHQHGCSRLCASKRRDYDKIDRKDFLSLSCACCGGHFASNRHNAKYCSPECKAKQGDADRYDKIKSDPSSYMNWIDTARTSARMRNGDRALASILTPMTGA